MTAEGFARLAFEAHHDADRPAGGGWDAWSAMVPDGLERAKWLAVGQLIESMLEDAQLKPAEPVRYQLVEQLGHRAMVGITREVTFCDKTMLEVERIDVVPTVTVRVNPDTFYDVTDLTPEQAVALSRTYGRSTNGLDAASVVTRYISERQQITAADSPRAHYGGSDLDRLGADTEDDEDESARELADEGTATAMSAAERDEYDRDGEAWLDARDEADEADL